MLRDNALVELRKKFEKTEQERDELKLKLENFQTSSKNISKLLASQITDKNGLGYDNQVFNSTVFDCDELISSESDVSIPTSLVHDRNHAMRGNHQHYARMTRPHPYRPTKHGVTKAYSPIRGPINLRPSPTHSNFHQKVTIVKATLGNPQHALKDKGVINNGCSRHTTGNISYLSEFEEINGGYVAFGGNTKGGKITSKGKIRTGKFDFDDVYFVKEIKINLFSVSQMCDKKNNTLFTDTECIVLSSDFKLPDENHVLLRVPRENNMYNVDLKNIVPVLVTKPHNKTPYELLLGRTPSIGFMRPFGCLVTILITLDPLGSGPTWLFDIDTLIQSMNYQPVIAGNQPNSSAGIQEHFDADKAREGNVQIYVIFPLWSTGSKDPQNTDADATFEVKERESEVHVSLSSSDKTKKHDDKAKREAKGKSPVELSTGVQDLSDDFEEFSDNSTNRVNATSTSVTVVGLNSTNRTNTFSAAGPFNNAVSLNFELGEKSSYVDPSQYPDDPDMPALEDITYSDDEEDVGAEADFSNLETNITVSPIPTTRVHEDHPITQIIGDLSLAPQTKSMIRMVKEQGFEDPDYPDKVYKVVKALYGLHQAPRAWYETLANYLLENDFQREKIDQTLFIKKQKGLQVKQKQDGIFIGQDKYVAKILSKFGLTDGKSASTPIDTEKPLLKDPDDIMFAICACARFQVTPKALHLHAVKRIFSNEALAIPMQMTTGKENSNPFMADSLPITILLTFILGICINMAKVNAVSTDRGVNTPRCDEDSLGITGIDVCINGKPHHLCILYKAILVPCFTQEENDVVRLQALIDRRNVIITEDTVRQALRLDDADSIDCLPNDKIFAELARMGVGKGFSRVDTLLFDGMLVSQQVQDDVATAAEDEDAANDKSTEPTPPSPTPVITPPPQQELIPSPSQVESTPPPSPHQTLIAQPSSPPPQQPL
uniref:Putative ribonuclease H-like domain-containing protein n=1 Tax=Tanacetum cinerariifolium TaxID=118510 RepID=A0A6L2N1L0_TANCI|nr:putative ribonuclease H-like domain-containing protein [Tanacetum cinerariifolium]